MKGKDTVVRNLLAAVEKIKGAAAAALYQEGLALDANAVKRTPVDTGRLRASHYVGPPVANGGELVVEVGFGTDYAVFVHERTDLAHKVGEAKFLQNAMNERSAGFLERVQKRTKSNRRAGITSAVLDPRVPTRPSVEAIDAVHDAYRERRGRVLAKRKARREARRDARRKARAERDIASRWRDAERNLAKKIAKQRKKTETSRRKAEARTAARYAKAEAKAAAAAARKQRRANAAHAKRERAYAQRWKAAEKKHFKVKRHRRRRYKKR